MTYYLQMTYIPSLDEQGKFFIWITDQSGSPVVQMDDKQLRSLLSTSTWHSYFMLEQSRSKRILLEDEEQFREVDGLLVPMGSMYQLLQYNTLLQQPRYAGLQFGDSFLYWQKIAKNLAILLDHGQYYPSLITVEKEGQHYTFAQWMLSRRLLHSFDLFNSWIRSLPALVLSALDLAHLHIRQWLDVLLDTWVDQLLRSLLEPAFSPHLAKWPESPLFQELGTGWFYYLMEKENTYFHVTSERNELVQIQKLTQQIEKWHKPLVSPQKPSLRQTLIHFKQAHMQAYREPTSLILHFVPMDEEDPFSEWSVWDIQLKVEVMDGEEPIIVEADEIWSRHRHARSWLEEKINKLILIDDLFYPLNQHNYRGDFELEASGDRVAEFYQKNAHSLDSLHIHFQFPSWFKWKDWSAEEVEVSLETNMGQESLLSLASLVQFNWKISIGDVSLPVAEFMALVEQGTRFVRHQGEWVELPLDKIMTAYHEMNEVDNQLGRKGRMSDLLKLSLAEKHRRRKHLRLDIHPQAGTYLKRLLENPKQTLEVPSQFIGTLRPYQQQGFTWLSSLREKGVGGCLADDMGLGKTIQAISYLLTQKGMGQESGNRNPALIICPTSLIGNWQRELQFFSPSLSVYAHHGPNRYKQQVFEKKRENYDVMITSYAIMIRDAEWMRKQEWPSLIIDEAQAIKNPSAKQSQIIRSLLAAHRLALTGTPMENRLEELWSIMDFLNPGYLGSLRGFRQQFITPIEKHQNQQQAKLLKRLIQPFLLRRSKSDPTIINDLPDKIEKKEICSLTKEQASLYQSVVDELMRKMRTAQGIERKGLILATLTKLKQVCDHPYLLLKTKAEVNHSGKLERFLELLDSLLENEQSALVFTQYVGMGELLQQFIQKKYKDCPVFFLHGGISSTKREELIHNFRQYKEQKAIFILSLKAGGVGLNLTEANHVIHYDRWWNPAVEDQATDRAYRIGQQKNVHVYKLISEGTLEEGIDQLIEKKRNLTDQIIGQGEGWVTEMTDDEVYQLIRLRERVISS